jgi:hypothetical protein
MAEQPSCTGGLKLSTWIHLKVPHKVWEEITMIIRPNTEKMHFFHRYHLVF